MLGDISSKRVLDLGCGYGWFCRYAASPPLGGGGAGSVTGMEISEKMLARAEELDYAEKQQSEKEGRSGGMGCAINYLQANLETVELERQSVEVVTSSLTLHYLPNPALARLFDQIHAALVDGGVFVFSVEHPILTAPIQPAQGWRSEEFIEEGKQEREVNYWPLNSYALEGQRTTDWLAKGVRKYHRKTETYVSMLIEKGFMIECFRESWDGMKADEKEAGRPFFLMLRVKKSV